jgi:hypothetical protein
MELCHNLGIEFLLKNIYVNFVNYDNKIICGGDARYLKCQRLKSWVYMP